MKGNTRKSIVRHGLFAVIAVALLGGVVLAGMQFGNKPIVAAETPDGETKRVVVQFKDVQAVTSKNNVDVRQKAIAAVDAELQEAKQYIEGYKQKVTSYDNLPVAIYEVDAAGEAALRKDPRVASVAEEAVFTPQMNTVLSTIGGSTTTGFTDTDGTYTGAGTAIAVLDTGTLTSHMMMTNKIVAEACFSLNHTQAGLTVESLCQNDAASAVGSGASSASCGDAGACSHGTHVASIAAGGAVSGTVGGSPVTLAGVAKDAKIVSIQVFSKVTSALYCSTGSDPCVLAFASSVISAVDHIINLSVNNTLGMPIVAANMSLGGGAHATHQTCSYDNTAMATALRANNIAPIIANGNSGDVAANAGKIAAPACLPGAIAVGATNKAGTQVASYSQNGALTTLLAPGGDYDGVDPLSLVIAADSAGASDITAMQGTSMASPVVAGAFAVLREKHPKATVAQLVTLLQNTGVNVTDTRPGYDSVVKKRIALGTALSQSPYAAINSFAGPSGTLNEGATVTLTGTVAHATSCSINNGVGAVTLTGGSFSRTVPGAASYTLTCLNAYGDTTTRTVNFTINTAPSVPTTLENVEDKNKRTFAISWGQSTDANGILEYRVSLNGQQVAAVDADITSYTFEDIDFARANVVEVRAVDTLGAISQPLSIHFGQAPQGEGQTEGVPNTGLAVLATNSGVKAAAVLILGLGLVAGTVAVVRHQVRK